jgi:hypothetical protein
VRLEKKELVSHLEMLEPALAQKAIIEAMVCVWFDGSYMFGFNDSLGVAIPFKTDFKGGVRCEQLLGFLDKSRARYVNVELLNDKELHLSIGKGFQSNLMLLEMEYAPWAVPEFNVQDSFIITQDFLRGLENVLVSVGNDTSLPDTLGVTLHVVEDTVNFYSTTAGKNMSWCHIPKPDGICIEYAIFSKPFISRMINVCGPGSQLGILTENEVLVKTENGRFVFSRLIESQRPFAFQDVVKKYTVPYSEMVPIPKDLRFSLERMMVLFANNPGEPAEVQVIQNWLKLHAQSPLGEVKDAMKLEEPHEDVIAYHDPELIKRIIPRQEKIRITADALLMTNAENTMHFVSPLDKSI